MFPPILCYCSPQTEVKNVHITNRTGLKQAIQRQQAQEQQKAAQYTQLTPVSTKSQVAQSDAVQMPLSATSVSSEVPPQILQVGGAKICTADNGWKPPAFHWLAIPIVQTTSYIILIGGITGGGYANEVLSCIKLRFDWNSSNASIHEDVRCSCIGNVEPSIHIYK